jgi:hypothetical protein
MAKTLLRIATFFLPAAFAALSSLAQTVTDPSDTPGYDANKLLQVSSQQVAPAATAPTVTMRLAPVTAATAATSASLAEGCFIPRDNSYTAVPRNDDGSLGPINLPFAFNLYGVSYSKVWINTNGNLTFTGAFGEYTASGFPTGTPMVAGYWADVDTRSTSSGNIAYKVNPTNLIVTWERVAYFGGVNLLNTFQIIIGTSNDPLLGFGQNVSLRYGDMQWSTSGSGSGGSPATVGVNAGNGTNFVQVGRFQNNGTSYDGPGGASDGVNYLDNKCFSFNASNAGNVPPSASNLPPNNTVTLAQGQTVTLSPQFLAPEVNQTTELNVNLNGLCNATATVTNGTTASASIAITGAACNVGSHVITLTATDNGSPVGKTTVDVTVVVTAPLVLAATHANATCTGASDGSIDLQVTNGNGATYAWTGPNSFAAATQDISGLAAGTYTVTVSTPANGTASTSVVIAAEDRIAPTVRARDIAVLLDANGNARILSEQVDNGSTDNCSVASVTVTPSAFTCANLGPNSVVLTVTDASGNTSTANAVVTVVDRILPTITAPVAVAVGTDAGSCSASVVALGTPVAADNCTVASVVSNAPTTFPIGATTVIWTATDAAGNKATAEQVVTVTDNQNPTITAPKSVTRANDATVCSAAYAAASSWLGTPVTADNCTVASVTNDAPTSFAQGATTVTWTVTDAAGNTATATQTITVVDKEKPVLKVPAPLARSTEATSCAAATGAWLGSATASDNCSGVVTLTNDAPASFPLGTTTVTYQAVDAAGNIATATQLVTITNDTPVINAVSGPVAPLPLSTTATMTASFTDNNLTAATWTWDDGTSSPGTISGTTVSGTHTYLSPGVNHVSLTITDACGLTATKTFEYVVVYDPNGGFVTGGGSILSPVNTTLPYMQVGGKATFGFVAKYAKGSQVAGNTDFQFQAGNLTFKSSSLTDARLVIAGSIANYKGVGTINGTGNYGFMVAAVDGDYNKGTGPDKFRMKIWEVAGGKVVYDNQAGDGEDATASTVIANGSIVIHNANDKASAATASVRLLPDGSPNASLEAMTLTSYPNPFSAQTTLAFSFAQAQDYTLAIYDLKGVLVQRVQASRAQAGQRYEVTLDAQALSSGLYVARLTTSSGVQTLKLVVQK